MLYRNLLYLSVYFYLSRSRSVSVLLAVYFSRVTRPRVGVSLFHSIPLSSFAFSLFHSSCDARVSARVCICVCVYHVTRVCVCVASARTRLCLLVRMRCCDRLLSAVSEAQLPHAVLYGSIVLSLESYTRNRVREKRVLSTIDDDDNRFSFVWSLV